MSTMMSKMVSLPSSVSKDLVQSVDQKICDMRRMTILEFLFNFCILCKIIAVSLAITSVVRDGFRKSSWVFTKCREWLQL
jgi:hypothetical protein